MYMLEQNTIKEKIPIKSVCYCENIYGDDDIVENYMGFTITFEDNLEPVLVRLHNEGKGWGIVAIEAAEED